MVESTKGFGTMIKDMARDTKNTLMVIFTKESSKMVKHTAKASILGLLERPMKETGNKASRKDTEFGKRKMEILISENGIKAKLMAMEYILGKTEIGMRENGNTDLNMVKVLIFMLLVIPIQDSTLRVNLTVTENISGKMAVSTLEILKMASNMVKENGLKIKMHPILITMKVIISWTNKHGYGVFKWASGNVYKGNYKEDQRHGYGEMYWTDGSVYKGEWIRGIQHGYGEMVFPDGTKKIGMFDHNTFVSPVQDNSFITKDIIQTSSNSQERNIPALNDSYEMQQALTTKNMNNNFSKTKLRPIKTPNKVKFSSK